MGEPLAALQECRCLASAMQHRVEHLYVAAGSAACRHVYTTQFAYEASG